MFDCTQIKTNYLVVKIMVFIYCIILNILNFILVYSSYMIQYIVLRGNLMCFFKSNL